MVEEIGYGRDGCVYQPGFCRNKSSSRRYISKVMIKGIHKAEREMDKYKRLDLSKLDPEMKYFISDPEFCELDATDSRVFEAARRDQDCKLIRSPYVALNYINGGTDLHVILGDIRDSYDSRNPLPLNKWNDYFFALKNIFVGLQLLHENGIYHMDVKPDNIVFDETEDPPQFKLIDFGLSCTEATPPKITTGSEGYIPPEMYDEPTKYKKADIWALGTTLMDFYSILMEGPYDKKTLTVYKDIKNLAKLMTDDYRHRINIDEALHAYIIFLLNLDMTPEELAEYQSENKSSKKKKRSSGGRKSKHIRSKHIRSKYKQTKYMKNKTKRRPKRVYGSAPNRGCRVVPQIGGVGQCRNSGL
jgi:serine/threonine protein kinase